MNDENALVPAPNVELVQASEAPQLLTEIRPAWQAKNLIDRVTRLLRVDPSSACQRLFNAAVHDLREKIVVAGVDIASEAASQYKLPPVKVDEDIVHHYSVSNVIDLAYRMGLLTRPEYRRVSRCYEIRRDLEHEDDEYEAGVEDCVYIFRTCIKVVLARDPIEVLRVDEIRDLMDGPEPAKPSASLVEDYERAPGPRQEHILIELVGAALNQDKPDIVQENAYAMLGSLAPKTDNKVLLKLVDHFQKRTGKRGLDARTVRVAQQAGVFPYLRKAHRIDFFRTVLKHFQQVGHNWGSNAKHGALLRDFIEFGGLDACPDEVLEGFVRWLVLAYIGVRGGRTRYGHVRHVYYSNSAAPLIEEIFNQTQRDLLAVLERLRSDSTVEERCQNQHVAQRFESLVDLASR